MFKRKKYIVRQFSVLEEILSKKTLSSMLIIISVRIFQPSKTKFQKQPPRGVLSKRCSKNMQQIYRRTPMAKCDFNKVTKQLNKITLGVGVLL